MTASVPYKGLITASVMLATVMVVQGYADGGYSIESAAVSGR